GGVVLVAAFAIFAFGSHQEPGVARSLPEAAPAPSTEVAPTAPAPTASIPSVASPPAATASAEPGRAPVSKQGAGRATPKAPEASRPVAPATTSGPGPTGA